MPETTPTTRFAWSEDVNADKTEVRKLHIDELREAADYLDAELDDHIGKGGPTRHPTVTNDLSGFMDPTQKHSLDLWDPHKSEDGRIIGVTDPVDPTDAVNLQSLDVVKDSYAMKTARYSFSTNHGNYTHRIDMSSWKTEWDTFWTTKYPNRPNPGFKIVVIPAITGARTGDGTTYYGTLTESIKSITRVAGSDVMYDVVVDVTGGSGHYYSCNGWANFTFTILGASCNMFNDYGSVLGL